MSSHSLMLSVVGAPDTPPELERWCYSAMLHPDKICMLKP